MVVVNIFLVIFIVRHVIYHMRNDSFNFMVVLSSNYFLKSSLNLWGLRIGSTQTHTLPDSFKQLHHVAFLHFMH
jgi:hypothetical protein